MINIKKHVTVSNITSVVLIALLLAMLFFPSFKGTVMQGLLHTGLFSPRVPKGSTGELEAAFVTHSTTDPIQFENPQGEMIELADQQGKVVFLNFWATWC